ncbi:hypothetical protein DICPUDRAFT_154698 [Dictyostelium purpureum]|uniref:MYND-type domain-containing protein n=1 Tax=Dictyostelium purpureum TaxID=5786 RepID=F0ZS12_DICPU|nr:uncharacterized protein DICPUDRAFT_154698 [Dictyostelium purpureum]EGC33255.1 hypothetical protein DICPUDRAFT_154698 [Dictyostelium purpureum]|eukprot:XP_003290202.1 hypothetical protein DICPUDRAFT_154698 [Dictyostelium purpureum]
MASVYTTKRGKTKKAKLGIRKDANNNAANKLNSKLKTESKKVTTEPKELFKSQQELLLKQNGELFNPTLALAAKCSNNKCKSGKIDNTKTKLLLCSACGTASYCSRDCQVEHWSNGHKEKCIKIRQKKEEEAKKNFDFLNSQIDALSKVEIKEKKVLDFSTFVKDEQPDIINIGKKSEEETSEETATDNKTNGNSVNWELFKNDDIPEIEEEYDEEEEEEDDEDEEDEE